MCVLQKIVFDHVTFIKVKFKHAEKFLERGIFFEIEQST